MQSSFIRSRFLSDPSLWLDFFILRLFFTLKSFVSFSIELWLAVNFPSLLCCDQIARFWTSLFRVLLIKCWFSWEWPISLSSEVDLCIVAPALVSSASATFNPATGCSKLGWPFLTSCGPSAHLRCKCVRDRNEATLPLLWAGSPVITSAGLRESNNGSGSIRKARLLWWDILALTSVVEDAVSPPASTEAALVKAELGPWRSATSSRWPKTLSNGY